MKAVYYLFLTAVFLSIVVLYSLSAWHGGSGSIDTLLAMTTPSPAAKNLSDQSGHKIPSLLKDLISKIKTFVLFIGRERGGSSIVGALMNAHPHMAIAHEYYVFRKWPTEIDITSDNWTSSLYNSLYHKTLSSSFRGKAKGYTLSVNDLWQGNIDEYLSVIGDKGAGSVYKQYKRNKKIFIKKYHQLKNKISIPIRFIHTLRNPFDHIATSLVYRVNRYKSIAVRDMKNRASSSRWKYDNQKRLMAEVNDFFRIFEVVMEMVGIFGRENVHVVHSSDLVHSPRETMSKLCEFVGVESTKDYLDVCERKVFKDVSRSRDVVVWNKRLIEMVEEKMKHYPLYYQRYNFTSN